MTVTRLATNDASTPRSRLRRLLIVILAGLLLGIGIFWIVGTITQPRRTTEVYDQPVLAGQQLLEAPARRLLRAARGHDRAHLHRPLHEQGREITYDPDGTTVRGVFEPAAQTSCPYPGHQCASSPTSTTWWSHPDRIPWGHLNVVDLGTAGYRIIPPGTRPLACADIAIGDLVEIDGRNTYRSGTVAEKGQNLFPEDGDYFPCMIAAGMSRRGSQNWGVRSWCEGSRPASRVAATAAHSDSRPWPRDWTSWAWSCVTTPDCGLTPRVGGGFDRR